MAASSPGRGDELGPCLLRNDGEPKCQPPPLLHAIESWPETSRVMRHLCSVTASGHGSRTSTWQQVPPQWQARGVLPNHDFGTVAHSGSRRSAQPARPSPKHRPRCQCQSLGIILQVRIREAHVVQLHSAVDLPCIAWSDLILPSVLFNLHNTCARRTATLVRPTLPIPEPCAVAPAEGDRSRQFPVLRIHKRGPCFAPCRRTAAAPRSARALSACCVGLGNSSDLPLGAGAGTSLQGSWLGGLAPQTSRRS